MTKKVEDITKKRRKKKEEVPAPVLQDVDVAEEELDDPRLHMTWEEIQAFMQAEEEELDNRLGKFVQANPQPPEDAEKVEEEEEEEHFTINLEDGTVTQKEEAAFIKDEDGNVSPIDTEALKYLLDMKPTNPYIDLIADKFVSKAIASLVKKIRKVEDDAFILMENTPSMGGARQAVTTSYEAIRAQKNQLLSAISGGKVHHDRIPDWAKEYIDNYIDDVLNGLIGLGERE